MIKRNRTNDDLKNTTQKTKDRAPRTPQETSGELRRSGRVSSSCFTSSTCPVTLVTSDKSRFTASDYPFGIFKLVFLSSKRIATNVVILKDYVEIL
jgi:hypothetical protein